MFRNKIFLITRRNGHQYYVKALDMGCAINVLQGYGVPCKTIVPAPGHCKEALLPFDVMLAEKERKNG